VMSSGPDLLTQYGLPIIFGWAFAVQAGAPAPALPMLIGAGALSGAGRMNLALAIAAAMAATLAADVLWYWLGRFHGARVLELLCRFSLDPDSLIRHAKERFVAHRLRYLVLAKFLPGVNPLAAGLAGAVPIRLDRFVLYAAAGALLWAGAWMTLGYLCADVIVLIATGAGRLGTPLVLVIAAALLNLSRLQVCETATLPTSSPEGSHHPDRAQSKVASRRSSGDLRFENDAGHRDHSVRNPGRPLDFGRSAGRATAADPQEQRGGVLLRRAQRGDERPQGAPAGPPRL
jgi:membrane protein DedA with SNARE-associated domain